MSIAVSPKHDPIKEMGGDGGGGERCGHERGEGAEDGLLRVRLSTESDDQRVDADGAAMIRAVGGGEQGGRAWAWA